MKKAELIEKNKKREIHSATQSFPWPSVIRLNRYIKLPYRKTILTRKNILKREKHKCAYCGRSDLPLTIDHIIPRTQSGKDTWENLVAACLKCNNKKGGQTPEEAGMKLLVKPYSPNHITQLKNIAGRYDETWNQYLFVQ